MKKVRGTDIMVGFTELVAMMQGGSQAAFVFQREGESLPEPFSFSLRLCNQTFYQFRLARNNFSCNWIFLAIFRHKKEGKQINS
jgi:hypothetical protein